MLGRFVLAAALSLVATPAAARQSPQDYVDRAVDAYEAGRTSDALKEFETLARLVPDIGPALWQRGIVLYQLGRFAECAQQFLDFQALSPDDAEDAAWHFFCVAKAESVDAARRALLPAAADGRVMRREVWAMLSGRIPPEEVLARASGLAIAEFYAYLYVGLYSEATGDAKAALVYLTEAAAPRYAEYGGFMNLVARVRRDALKAAAAP